MNKLVLASGNPGKLAELQQMLTATGIELVSQATFDTPSVAETGLTFVENAIIKARHACEHSGLPAIADDSGLEVDALAGQPGIYSARYAGVDASDADNNRKLLHALEGKAGNARSARFQCVVVLMRHGADPTPLICQGSWEGFILETPSGANGFGYDPLFEVAGRGCSSAQLDKAEKNRISHRGQAMAKLLQQLTA